MKLDLILAYALSDWFDSWYTCKLIGAWKSDLKMKHFEESQSKRWLECLVSVWYGMNEVNPLIEIASNIQEKTLLKASVKLFINSYYAMLLSQTAKSKAKALELAAKNPVFWRSYLRAFFFSFLSLTDLLTPFGLFRIFI